MTIWCRIPKPIQGAADHMRASNSCTEAPLAFAVQLSYVGLEKPQLLPVVDIPPPERLVASNHYLVRQHLHISQEPQPAAETEVTSRVGPGPSQTRSAAVRRRIRFVIELPDPADLRYTDHSPSRERSTRARKAAHHEVCRQKLRALPLVVKDQAEKRECWHLNLGSQVPDQSRAALQ